MPVTQHSGDRQENHEFKDSVGTIANPRPIWGDTVRLFLKNKQKDSKSRGKLTYIESLLKKLHTKKFSVPSSVTKKLYPLGTGISQL
jgi:hypothetical protein